MKLTPKFTLVLMVLFLLNAFNDVFAAQVAAVKGKKVLVMGDDLETNGLYYVVERGKKKGIIKVLKIKGRKALAKLLKGRAGKGFSLVYRPRKSKSRNQVAKKSQTPSTKNYDKYSETPSTSFDNSSNYKSNYRSSRKKSFSLGGLLAYQQNSASVNYTSGSSDSLSGSSIGFKVFGDYPLNKKINLRGEFGTIPFNAEVASNNCGGSTCSMAISYLGATLWARYMFNPETAKTRFWGGASASLIFPTGTGDTNAVNADDVGSTLIFGLGGGLDYNINEKYYIPVSLEYTLFPPNDEVSANIIGIKAGLGMRL